MAAYRAGRPADVTVSTVALGLSALPEYVVCIVLLLLFGVKMPLFPVISSGVTSWQIQAFVLPVMALSLIVGAYIFRLARVSIAESLESTYVRTAVLNGFSPLYVLSRHVLPNVGVVVMNVIAQNALYLLGGVIVVENVFAYPGLGTLLVQAITNKDYTLVEGAAVVLSVLFITIMLLSDALTFVFNPRLRTRDG
jgi:peptide/nickel transport system permease protein